MRIGVITYNHSKDNYGQILQCFALQEYLKKEGHNPFVIDYNRCDDVECATTPSFFSRLWSRLIHFPKYFQSYVKRKAELKKNELYKINAGFEDRELQRFIKKHVDMTAPYSHSQLLSNPPQAEAYVCGSDIIWGGGDLAYFLDFAPEKSIKIAYAPSCGGNTVYTREKEIKTLLKRFAGVGIREQSGVELIHSLGRNDAIKVVDPTLLLSKDDYDKIRSKSVPRKKNYAFIYLLGNKTMCPISKVMEFVNKCGLEYVYVASQGQVDRYEKYNAKIGEWIDCIANASIVITNSFHCSVFASIYHRPFLSLALGGSMSKKNTRIIEFLENSKLANQIVYEHIQIDHVEDVNFDSFEFYKAQEIVKTNDFFNQLLKL